MARIANCLCDLGMQVSQEKLDVMDARGPEFEFPHTLETLQCHKGLQEQVKEQEIN